MIQLALAPTRRTSATCLRQIRDEGLLGAMQLEAYELLLDHGPLTGQELDQRADGRRGHLHKRLPELQRRGLARALPPRRCLVTGRQAISWEALDALPAAADPRPTRVNQVVEQLARAFIGSDRAWTGDEVAETIRRLAGER